MKYVIKNKHWNIVEDYNIDKLLYLLIDRADQIDFDGDFWWKNNKGECHRDYDLPSNVWYLNDLGWMEKGQISRNHGKPAIIHRNGIEKFSFKGKHTTRKNYELEIIFR